MPRIAFVFVCLFAVGETASAQAPADPLVDQVKAAIDKGVAFLIDKQLKDGSWEAIKKKEDDKASHYPAGPTALAILALLQCDAIIDDPQLEQKRQNSVKAGLANLRDMKSDKVYVISLQTMALAENRDPKDRKLIERNVEQLIAMRGFRDGKFIGWSYTTPVKLADSDASNSQFAMLALWYARQAGVRVDREVWTGIQQYYSNTQNGDGSWKYSDYYALPGEESKPPSLTMTIAGICGLQIASMELNGGREQWQPNGSFTNCGNYRDERRLSQALRWLAKSYNLKPDGRAYYHLYGLERAGRLTGHRFFGEHDWYREGCEFLVKQQAEDGSWKNRETYDRWPHINTSFALLFLSKGRTPVLISKIVHGKWPRGDDDFDWNNDRNDLRHLTEFVATTGMFGKKPLAWQTYDIARALEAAKGANAAQKEGAIVADMKQSPILYITGHESLMPQRFTGAEVAILKRYVDNGGFIFAEACCGSERFDAGFKRWVKDTWEQDLEYLDSSDPVWSCEYPVQVGQPYKLMGLKMGCRTVLIYSPQDLSCHWESNRLDDGKAQVAFRLGANIVAYATGRTTPKPRLTKVEVIDEGKFDKRVTGAGVFHVAQIHLPGESPPAPRAMGKVLERLHNTKDLGLDVSLKAETILLHRYSDKDIRREKFFYMHGRGEFNYSAEDAAKLRFTLKNGGLLFADACCGKESFDKSFRKFAQELFPKEKLVRVPFEGKERDPIFGEEYNETALTPANIQCRTTSNGKMQDMAPFLEGIKIDGRWVVLYSRYDIGCALEHHTSPSCIGYSYDSAMRIASAVLRYHLKAEIVRPSKKQ